MTRWVKSGERVKEMVTGSDGLWVRDPAIIPRTAGAIGCKQADATALLAVALTDEMKGESET